LSKVRITLAGLVNWICRKLFVGGHGWIELAQDGDRWRAIVNVVMNVRVTYNAETN